MHDNFIEEVVNEVLSRLTTEQGTTYARPVCLMLGEPVSTVTDSLSSRYSIVSITTGRKMNASELMLHARKAALIVATELSVSNLCNLARGCASNALEEAFLDCLLLGRQVYVLEDGISLTQFKDTAPKNLYRRLLEDQQTLISYGVKLITQNQLLEGQSFGIVRQQETAKRTDLDKKLILEKDLYGLSVDDCVTRISIQNKAIITPMAMDYAKEHHIEFIRQ